MASLGIAPFSRLGVTKREEAGSEEEGEEATGASMECDRREAAEESVSPQPEDEWEAGEAEDAGVEAEAAVAALVGVTMGGVKPSPPKEEKKSPVVLDTKRSRRS